MLALFAAAGMLLEPEVVELAMEDRAFGVSVVVPNHVVLGWLGLVHNNLVLTLVAVAHTVGLV